jgi:hypothetical protein
VQLAIERLGVGDEAVEQLHHLGVAHVVVGHLQREVARVLELARDLVAQLLQLHQARLERLADLLRRLPGFLSK